MRVHSRVRTLVFMFWENSRMVSTLVQASGWSFRLVRTSWATRCYNTEPPLYICSDKYNLVKWRYLRSILKRNLTWVHILLLLITFNILHLMNNCCYLLVCRFRLLSVDCLLQVDYWSIATEHQLKLHSFYSWRKYIQPMGGLRPHLGSNVVVHGVDNIVQQVDVQFLTEVQQLSGWVIRQHRHFCWHRASEGRGGEMITLQHERQLKHYNLYLHMCI